MSHTNLIYHIIFATKNRSPIIQPEWELDLHRYLGGIINGFGGSAIEINGIEDHVHSLAKLPPKTAVSDFLRAYKSDSSSFAKREFERGFGWQKRYGAFSVSESNVEAVRRYIQNQKAHHRKQSFEDEYKLLLNKNRVDFDDRYLWE